MRVHATVDPVLLMCPPEHYRIREPHPSAGHANDQSHEGFRVYQRDPAGFLNRSMKKWEALRTILERELGATIRTTDPVPGLDDQVFAADASISLVRRDEEGGAVSLLSRFTYDERQPEAEIHAAHLRAFDPARDIRTADFNIEGCGDNVYDALRDVFWSGCTRSPARARAGEGRSDARAHAQLAEFTGVEVIGLEVRRPFFHLDTTVAVLPHGHVLCGADGLTPAARSTLISRAFEPFGLDPDEYLINVSREDAERYACNVVTRDDVVVLPTVSDELLTALASKGYRPIPTDLTEFIHSGGGPHCLVNQINEPRKHGTDRAGDGRGAERAAASGSRNASRTP